MELPTLAADCESCAALCCVDLAFDKSNMFAFDKPAGIPCPKLDADNRCTIHDRLKDKGQAGCARYDCLGAGQYVVQILFKGRSWRTDPELAEPMFEAFRLMREIHELIAMLDAARRLPLDPAQADAVKAWLGKLVPAQGWTTELLEAYADNGLAREIRAFLPELREAALAGRQ